MAETLRRTERIRRRAEFQQVYEQGARVHGRYLTLLVLSNGLAVSRLGIVATRKLGGAVRRNRAKRLVRELFRHNKPAPGLDVIVIPRPELPDVPFDSLQSDYRASLRRRVRR